MKTTSTNGEILTKFRKTNKIKAIELAKLLGVTPVYLSYIEHGKRPLTSKILKKLELILPSEIYQKLKENQDLEKINKIEIMKKYKECQDEIIRLKEQLKVESQNSDLKINKENLLLIAKEYLNSNVEPNEKTETLKQIMDIYLKTKG